MLHEAAPCTCGLLYGSCGGGCSMLFATAAPGDYHHHYYSNSKQCGDDSGFNGSSYGGGSVDCTLSLGTPSTRRAAEAAAGLPWETAAVSSCNGNARQETIATAPRTDHQSANNNASAARRCANCDTTSTPLWRNGPRGPKVRNVLTHVAIYRLLVYEWY